MREKHRKLYTKVLDTLVENECVKNYTIKDDHISVEWTANGFNRAFSELKRNSVCPFGLGLKEEPGVLLLVLKEENPDAISEWSRN